MDFKNVKGPRKAESEGNQAALVIYRSGSSKSAEFCESVEEYHSCTLKTVPSISLSLHFLSTDHVSA